MQQQSERTAQARSGLEGGAARTASAVVEGGPARVEGHTGGPRVQGLSAAGEWAEGKMWSALEAVAPALVPILRKGLFTWLTEKITAAVEVLFERLMKPVRAVTGLIESLSSHFVDLVQWIKEAAAKIAKGDCSSITEAAEKIQAVVSGLAAPVIEKVQGWAASVKGFFVDMWDQVGAPVWDFLKSVGGAIWDTIKDIAAWIWDQTKPIRKGLASAWTWVKDTLGIGEGPEGQNGILQWVQEKASIAWTAIKGKLEPYKKQILVVAGVILAITGGPIFAVAAVVAGLIFGIRWIARHLRTRGSVVEQRGALEREVIPKIMGAVKAVSGKLGEIAASLTEKFGAIVSGLGKAAGLLAGSIVDFLVGAVQWLIGKFKLLLAWATEKVQAIAGWVKSALERLKTFLEPVFEVVRWIGAVAKDIFNLVSGVIKGIWNKIPGCIKDPVTEFLVNQILKRIPIFSKLLEISNIWDKVKGAALDVIRNIFVKWDIKAAVLRFFDLVLEILEIPKDLLRSIYAKARTAFEEIVKDPIGFLRNTFKAMFEGFGLFFGNISKHLWNGLMGWFRGQMKKAAIEVPTELSFKSILGLIFSIAGISVEKIFQILEKRLKNKPLSDKIRKLYRFLSGVWEWVSIAIEKGATGLWEKIKETAGSLWDALMTALVGWATKSIIKLASPRLLTALNPIGAIVNAILAAWAAIQTAAEYLKQILGIVDTVLDTALDLARGTTGRAAAFVEKALAAAVPMAVGFLANFLRLGNLGERVKEMLKPVQAKVEDAIGRMIDAALSAGRAMLEKFGLAKPENDKVTFDDQDGKMHTISAEGEGDQEKIYIESTRKDAEDHLKVWRPESDRVADSDEKRLAKTAIEDMDIVLADPKKRKATNLPALKAPVKLLMEMLGHPLVPPTKISFDEDATEKWVEARPLTLKSDSQHQPSTDTNAPMKKTDSRMRLMNIEKQQWVKMHLLHFDLGGPNKAWNFIPGTKSANGLMFQRVEDTVIKLLTSAAEAGNAILWYRATSSRHPKPDHDFSHEVMVEYGQLDPRDRTYRKAKKGTKKKKVGPFESDRPSGGAPVVASLSSSSARDLNILGGLDIEYARAIFDSRGAVSYADEDDIEAAVKAKRPRFVDFGGLKAAVKKAVSKSLLMFK